MAQGTPGSDNIFKTQMLEMLALHEVLLFEPLFHCADAPDTPTHAFIIKAVECSSHQGALDAPLIFFQQEEV